MITASHEFDNGRARMLNKGVNLWNGSEDGIGPGNAEREFNDLVYELIEAKYARSDGYNLKGVKVTIEIEEVTRQ